MEVMHPYENPKSSRRFEGANAFRPPVYSTTNKRKESEKMICPKCGENKCHAITSVRGVTTLLGTGAGGYMAAVTAGSTGATIGSFVCPGMGTAIGGLLGILVGAASGAVAGNTVGKLLDENVIRQYLCPNCGYTWRVA